MFTASRTSRQTSRRTRMNLTELGAKVVPAVVLTSLDLDGDGATDDIRITGDGAANKVTITDNGASSIQIKIDANGDGDTTDGADTNQTFNITGDTFVLEAKLGSGNDSFDYAVTANYDLSGRALSVDLGAGNDHVGWAMNTFDVNNHSRITLDVIGGAGNDQGGVVFDGVANSVVSVRSDWGGGKDAYTGQFGLIDTAAAVDVTTDLGGGTNMYDATFAGVGKFDVGTLDVAVTGGAGVDTVNIHMKDDIGAGQTKTSRATITADLGAGNDSFAVGFLEGDFLVDNNSQMSVSARGGLGNDILTARMEGSSASPARIDEGAMLSIALDGGAGNDTITTQFGSASVWQIKTGGTMQIRLNGGAGNDFTTCQLSNDVNSVANYDVAVWGGAGTDTALFSLANPGGTLTFGPAGGIILDGGAGTDTLTDNTPGFALKAGFETVK